MEYRDASDLVVVPMAVSAPPADGNWYAFDPRTTKRFRLLRVRPHHAPDSDLSDADRMPVVFVHGHRGAPSQANAFATIAHATYHDWLRMAVNSSEEGEATGSTRRRLPLAVYSLDMEEGSSAFHAGLMIAQARALVISYLRRR
jgi:hypothetical protein